jgi:hypothetical protein
MWKKYLLILPVILALTGCTSITTNVSATRQPRNAEGLYPVEVKFDSRQQSLRWDSVQVTVMVGKESYPMRRTHLMNNRWEGLIPVAAGEKSVSYFYKFNYDYTDFGAVSKATAASRTYKLQIID